MCMWYMIGMFEKKFIGHFGADELELLSSPS